MIDGELVAVDKNGGSHFQLPQNVLRHEVHRVDLWGSVLIFAGRRTERDYSN